MRAATGVAVVLTLLAAVAPWQAPVEAQEFTQRRRSQAEIDSMVAVARERKLPFFGEAIARKGIDLPLPIGITVHSYSQVQPTTFTDLAIGFNGSEKIPLGFVSFDNASSQVWSPQFRVDAWLLPFLNVYGLVGPTRANTEVLMEEPFPLVIRTDTDAVAYGVGGTLNGGFHHY